MDLGPFGQEFRGLVYSELGLEGGRCSGSGWESPLVLWILDPLGRRNKVGSVKHRAQGRGSFCLGLKTVLHKEVKIIPSYNPYVLFWHQSFSLVLH